MTGVLPWYKRNPQRCINATRELSLEERGAYNDLLDLLYLRDRRIPDDAQFVASFLHVSVRKWRLIRASLVELGRLTVVGEYLTDDYFERERAAALQAKRDLKPSRVRGGKARAEAAARDRQGQFLLEKEENGSNPPAQSSSQLVNSSKNAGSGDNEQKSERNQCSCPAAELDELDDSFLREIDFSSTFREHFADISRVKSASRNSENGSFPPRSSSSVRGRERASELRDKKERDSSSKDDRTSAQLKVEHVRDFWNEVAPQLGRPAIRDLTPERRQLVKARIAQFSVDDFRTVFAKCRSSPFLRGDKGRTPLTFDWLMKKTNFQKTLEGNYD